MTEAETGAEQLSPGRALAAARAELNLSVADVSHQIKYGVKQIEAIEADDYDKLPGVTFVRGMIRSYAKLLRIDPQPLLVGLGRSDTPTAVMVDLHMNEEEPFLEGGKKSNRLYLYLSVAALAVVAAVVYEWRVSPPATGEVVTITPKAAKIEEAPRASAAAEQVPGVVEPQIAEPSSPALASTPVLSRGNGPKRIELAFDELSWVEIKQADGKVMLSQLNPAGTRQVIEGTPPFEVVIGNAPKVHLTYDETPVDLRPYFKVDVARLTLD